MNARNRAEDAVANDTPSFRPGDIVRVRSGGPTMTVAAAPRRQGATNANIAKQETIALVYFEDGTLRRAELPAEVLVHVRRARKA